MKKCIFLDFKRWFYNGNYSAKGHDGVSSLK